MKWNAKIKLTNNLLKLLVYKYHCDVEFITRKVTRYKYIKETEEHDYDSPYLKTIYEVYLDRTMCGTKMSRLDDAVLELIKIKNRIEANITEKALKGGE